MCRRSQGKGLANCGRKTLPGRPCSVDHLCRMPQSHRGMKKIWNIQASGLLLTMGLEDVARSGTGGLQLDQGWWCPTPSAFTVLRCSKLLWLGTPVAFCTKGPAFLGYTAATSGVGGTKPHNTQSLLMDHITLGDPCRTSIPRGERTHLLSPRQALFP